MKYIKLSEWAKETGIEYQTAFKHFKKGLIENSKQLESGTILVGVLEEKDETIVILNNILNELKKINSKLK